MPEIVTFPLNVESLLRTKLPTEPKRTFPDTWSPPFNVVSPVPTVKVFKLAIETLLLKVAVPLKVAAPPKVEVPTTESDVEFYWTVY